MATQAELEILEMNARQSLILTKKHILQERYIALLSSGYFSSVNSLSCTYWPELHVNQKIKCLSIFHMQHQDHH